MRECVRYAVPRHIPLWESSQKRVSGYPGGHALLAKAFNDKEEIMSLPIDVLSICEDAFSKAGFGVSGLNVLHEGTRDFFRVMGMAEAQPGGPAILDMTDDTWAVGVAAKDASGKVVGVGEQAVSLEYSPVYAFDISVWPQGEGVANVAEVEVYPFVKRLLD